MNTTQIHLALTHVPVILSFTALFLLIVSLIKKESILVKTSYWFFIIAALAAVPVFLTGESTAEAIEKLPGVFENTIESHEEMADFAFFALELTGLICIVGLLLKQQTRITRLIKLIVLIFALAVSGLMAQTAHLGGQIRHTEIAKSAQFNTPRGDD